MEIESHFGSEKAIDRYVFYLYSFCIGSRNYKITMALPKKLLNFIIYLDVFF